MQPLNKADNEIEKVFTESSDQLLTRCRKFCRICLDEENASSPLISTCKCQGSIKYIHEDCLKKWILLRVFDPLNYQCDICKAALKMELNSKLVPSCQNIKSKLLRLFMIPLMFCVITNFILLSLFLFRMSVSDPKISIFIKIFLLLVFLSCSFINIVLIRRFVKAVKIGCFRRKIIHWKILENLENSQNDLTVLTENFENIEKFDECETQKENNKKGIQLEDLGTEVQSIKFISSETNSDNSNKYTESESIKA